MKERKIRVKHEVLQDLQKLKIELDMSSVSKVVKLLLEHYKVKDDVKEELETFKIY